MVALFFLVSEGPVLSVIKLPRTGVREVKSVMDELVTYSCMYGPHLKAMSFRRCLNDLSIPSTHGLN